LQLAKVLWCAGRSRADVAGVELPDWSDHSYPQVPRYKALGLGSGAEHLAHEARRDEHPKTGPRQGIELDWIKGTVGSDTNLPLVELLEKRTNCSSGSHMVDYGSLMEGVGRDSAEDNSHRGDVPNNGDGLP
jgi:hypothetical protein